MNIHIAVAPIADDLPMVTNAEAPAAPPEQPKASVEKRLEALEQQVEALMALKEVIACEDRLEEHDDRIKKLEKADIANSQSRIELAMENQYSSLRDLQDWVMKHKLNVCNAFAAIHDTVYYIMRFIPDQTGAPTQNLKRVNDATTQLNREGSVKRLKPEGIPGRVTAALRRRREQQQEGENQPLIPSMQQRLIAARDIPAGTFLGHLDDSD